MSSATPSPPGASRPLTAAEREWIRRQGVSARLQEAEQRRFRERLTAAQAELARLRKPRREGRRRFGAPPCRGELRSRA